MPDPLCFTEFLPSKRSPLFPFAPPGHGPSMLATALPYTRQTIDGVPALGNPCALHGRTGCHLACLRSWCVGHAAKNAAQGGLGQPDWRRRLRQSTNKGHSQHQPLVDTIRVRAANGGASGHFTDIDEHLQAPGHECVSCSTMRRLASKESGGSV